MEFPFVGIGNTGKEEFGGRNPSFDELSLDISVKSKSSR